MNIIKSLPLIALLSLTACSAPPQQTTADPDWAKVVDQQANLYRIDDKLYRSEQLTPNDYPLLKQQRIQTLINLRFFDRDDDKQAFGQTDLRLINTPLLTWHITPQDIAEVLWQIEQA